MAGVEIAGLVLGAIPLVIAALEHYEDALDPTIAFIRWNRELSAAIQNLWLQHTSYEQSIRLLLKPITSDRELHDMMNDSNNASWKSDDIADALRERLGDAYQAYMWTIQQIEKITTSLADKLDIEAADKVSQQGLEVIVLANPPSKKHGKLEFQFSKRVKFTMRRQKVKRLLVELDICNKRLDTYAYKAEKLEEPYKAEKKSKFALPLRLIEENATRLYDVLARTWCPAHSSHHAGLLLEPRLVKKRKGRVSQQNAEKCDANCFRISLLQSPSPRKWLDVEFRLVEERSNCQQVSSVVQVVVPSTPDSSTLYLELSQLQVVTNLCSVLRQPSHPWLGFYLESNGHLRGAYPAQPRALTYVENAVSLGEMLAERQASLSKEEVYTLSITLSSSLLQLSHTPWLGQSWDKADIIFLRAKDGSALSVDVKHPYLTREHKSDNASVIPHNKYPENDCSKLLALGVLLIEINASQPLESIRLPGDLVPDSEPNELTDLQASRRWVLEQKNKGDLTLGFYSAISHCLKCFVDPTASLQNPDFRRAVEEQVLAPLEEEFSFLFDPTAH